MQEKSRASLSIEDFYATWRVSKAIRLPEHERRHGWTDDPADNIVRPGQGEMPIIIGYQVGRQVIANHRQAAALVTQLVDKGNEEHAFAPTMLLHRLIDRKRIFVKTNAGPAREFLAPCQEFSRRNLVKVRSPCRSMADHDYVSDPAFLQFVDRAIQIREKQGG